MLTYADSPAHGLPFSPAASMLFSIIASRAWGTYFLVLYLSVSGSELDLGQVCHMMSGPPPHVDETAPTTNSPWTLGNAPDVEQHAPYWHSDTNVIVDASNWLKGATPNGESSTGPRKGGPSGLLPTAAGTASANGLSTMVMVDATDPSGPMSPVNELKGYATVPASQSAVADAGGPTPGSGAQTEETHAFKKRGISYNDTAKLAPFEGKVSWTYNWGPSGNGVGFVPMIWTYTDIGQVHAAVSSHPTAILSFNEPDHPDQANMSPERAADLHKQAFQDLKGQFLIGSPAITNGEPPMGLAWLTAWLEACGSACPVDFVAYHWYGADLKGLQQHTRAVIDLAVRYGISRIWLTEFGVDESIIGAEDRVATFMKTAVAWLESVPQMDRYCAFMAWDGLLLTDGKLNMVGQAYLS